MILLGDVAASSSTGAYAVLSLACVVITAVTGWLVYRLNARLQDSEAAQQKANSTADLIRAEHEGWVSLVGNLREQYESLVVERSKLQYLLEKTQHELSKTRAELANTCELLTQTRDRVTELERLLH